MQRQLSQSAIIRINIPLFQIIFFSSIFSDDIYCFYLNVQMRHKYAQILTKILIEQILNLRSEIKLRYCLREDVCFCIIEFV